MMQSNRYIGEITDLKLHNKTKYWTVDRQ